MTVGKDRFTFEAGPYHTICLSALTQPGFVCDFDAKIKSDNVVLLSIPRKLYLEAVAASKIANKRVRSCLFSKHWMPCALLLLLLLLFVWKMCCSNTAASIACSSLSPLFTFAFRNPCPSPTSLTISFLFLFPCFSFPFCRSMASSR